jgi:eukaryotic-like serine/threonine-protein kinase
MRPLAAGREIAPGIRVLEHLNRSRVLDVYDAWSERRDTRVVVKTLRPDRLRDRRAARALLREGALLRRLTHPNIVRGYEVHEQPRPAIVLETVGGETLAHLVRRRARRLSEAEVAHLGLHLVAALHHLHGEGVLHLDLKPSNVVAEAGRAKLLDLSIARPPGRLPAGRGTWSNMAPEQARGGDVGPAADVWGLGTVLYEALAGVNPFEDDDDLEYPQLTVTPRPLRDHRRVSPGLAALVSGSLSPDPADRPSLDDAREHLARVLA